MVRNHDHGNDGTRTVFKNVVGHATAVLYDIIINVGGEDVPRDTWRENKNLSPVYYNIIIIMFSWCYYGREISNGPRMTPGRRAGHRGRR